MALRTAMRLLPSFDRVSLRGDTARLLALCQLAPPYLTCTPYWTASSAVARYQHVAAEAAAAAQYIVHEQTPAGESIFACRSVFDINS